MAGLVTILGNPKRKKRRKMSALQRKYFGKGRKRKARTGKKRRRKGEVVIVATSNPRRKSVARKRRRSGRRKVRRIRARANPIRRRSRRRSRSRRFIRARRNPRMLKGGPVGFLTNTMVPAAVGAAGAIGVDLLIGNLSFIPQNWKQGNLLPVTQIGLSLGIGAAGSMVLGSEYGEQLAAGGIIVSLYTLAKSFVRSKFPNIQMARYVPMNRYLAAMPMRRNRRMGFIMRRRRLGNLPPNFKMRTIMRGAAIPGVNAGARNGGGMGYIGPARTMGRYLNK